MMLDEDNWTWEHGEKYGWCYNEYSGGFAGPGVLDSTYDPKSAIDFCVVGGETGPGARPMDPEWARSVRDQCREAQVPFWFKKMGAWYD
jgi:hypothetical protein